MYSLVWTRGGVYQQLLKISINGEGFIQYGMDLPQLDTEGGRLCALYASFASVVTMNYFVSLNHSVLTIKRFTKWPLWRKLCNI
jgi:hypothetical protein